MKERKEMNVVYLLFLILLAFSLSACSPSPEFERYKGSSLQIAVVGEAPDIKEEQVKFTEIPLEELTDEGIKAYDAVVILENNLPEAAEDQYADLYLDSTIPFFFMGTDNYVPFVEKELAYDQSMDWTAGTDYAVGILRTKEDSVKKWAYGLYNDEKTDEHVREVYSRIFETIDELEQ